VALEVLLVAAVVLLLLLQVAAAEAAAAGVGVEKGALTKMLWILRLDLKSIPALQLLGRAPSVPLHDRQPAHEDFRHRHHYPCCCRHHHHRRCYHRRRCYRRCQCLRCQRRKQREARQLE
jgi:ABC-type nickel/cobalt efflux system permease component RcnA